MDLKPAETVHCISDFDFVLYFVIDFLCIFVLLLTNLCIYYTCTSTFECPIFLKMVHKPKYRNKHLLLVISLSCDFGLLCQTILLESQYLGKVYESIHQENGKPSPQLSSLSHLC